MADVHVIRNRTVLAEEELGTNGFSHDFSFESLDFQTGDRVDFAVGCGANRNYYGDPTGLAATVSLLTAR